MAVISVSAVTLVLTLCMAMRMGGISGSVRVGMDAKNDRSAVRRPSLISGLAAGPPIHIAFCTDDTDLRGLVVAMKTAAAATGDPRRLVFHIVTSTGLAPLVTTMLNTYAKGVQFEVLQDTDLEVRLTAMVPYRPTSTIMNNQELGSPFNLAPFFLDELLTDAEVKRVLYLEPDVVVLGDVAQIFDMDMKGKLVVAVKDCFRRFDDVLNLAQLARLGFSKFDPQSCMLQRGVHLLDLEKYRAQHLRAKVEPWFTRYRDGEEDLWYEGLAGAPFNLIVGDDYLELDPMWNCFNLGEPEMGFEQVKAVRQLGFDHKSLLYDLDLEIADKTGSMTPHLSVCSSTAKVLHFSGMLKPWLREVWLGTPAPMCALPADFQAPERQIDTKETTLKGQPFKIMACVELWVGQLSEQEDCALKDFDKEWIGEELRWYNYYKKEQTRQQKEAEDKAARTKFKKEDRAARGGAAPTADSGKTKAEWKPASEAADDNIDDVGTENLGEKDEDAD